MNPEALQKMLGEMSLSIQKNQLELLMVNLQLQRRTNNLKLNELTLGELKQDNAFVYDHVWKGVGKAFFRMPTPEYAKEMDQENAELKEEVRTLTIKKNYVEKTLTNTVEGMNRIFEKR